MKKIIALLLSLTIILSLVACGQDKGNNKGEDNTTGQSEGTGDTGETEEAAGGGVTYSVALVADGAGFGSQSFNDVALEGLKKAEEDFGITLNTLEVKEAADLANSLRSLAQQGTDVIITPSSSIKDAVEEVSAEYPDVYFGLLDIQLEGIDNVISSEYREHEAAFLLGALGAVLTNTDTIGFVGGVSGTIQDRFQYGYMAGAKHANEAVEVLTSYTGSFSDVGKGKEIANLMYSSGADFIAPTAGACNLGVFQASEEGGADKFSFGAANGQFNQMPDKIVASQVKRVDNVAYAIVESLVNGTLEGGVSTVYGLEDGGVDLYYSPNETLKAMVTEEISGYIEELKNQIIDGTIVVPTNEAEYNSFIQ